MATASEIASLKSFVDKVTRDPDVLHAPELSFFREFLAELGAVLPKPTRSAQPQPAPEVNDPEIWTEDDSSFYQQVTPIANPSEDDNDKAQEQKAAASEAASPSAAVELLTAALRVKSTSAMYWAARAQYYLDWKKARCAIRDADRALELNSDSAKALRVRGVAFRHLGKWEEAARDLAAANTIDYDERSEAVTKLVTERAAAVRNARRAREIAEEEARARAAAQQQRAHQSSEEASPNRNRGAYADPAGFRPPAGVPPGMAAIFEDPEIQVELAKPGVMEKMSAAMANPALVMGLLSDPELGPVMSKIMAKMGGGMGGMPGMGGMGGMPGMGGMGGMPGMGGMGGGRPSNTRPAQPNVDEDLD